MVHFGFHRTVFTLVTLVSLVLSTWLLPELLPTTDKQVSPAYANSRWETPLYRAADWGGVDVFSNGNKDSSDEYGTYGWKYQCVELVQRFYAQKWGYDPIWNGNPHAWMMFDSRYHPSDIVAKPNGGIPGLQWGDVLVFNKSDTWQYGHVAIVTGVSGGRVHFAEQNIGSRPTLTATGRDSLPIDSNNWIGKGDKDSTFKIRSPLLGWLHSPRNGGNSSPPQSVTLQVKVAIEGAGAGIDLGVVRVQLRSPGAANDIAQQDLYVDKTGLSDSWSLPPSIVPNQQYDILVKGRQTLRRQLTNITLGPGANTVDFTQSGPLLVGDLNGDNKVNAFDYALLVKHFQPKDPGCADFNRDGTVNSFDWAYMRRNYNRVGDGGFMSPSNACLPPTQASSAAEATSVMALPAPDGAIPSSSGSTELVLSASSLSPAIGSSVDVSLFTRISGTSLAGAGILIQFDPGVFEYTGADASSAYPNLSVDSSQTAQGRVEVAGLARTGSPISTSGSLATLHFRVLRAISTTSIRARAHTDATAESHAVDAETIANTLLLTNASSLIFSIQGSPTRSLPTGQIAWPKPDSVLNGPGSSEALTDIVVEANDALNGVREVRVEAYYDNGWHTLGTDDDPTDGWSITWDLSRVRSQTGRIRAFVSLGDGVGVYTNEVAISVGVTGTTVATPTATPIPQVPTTTPVPRPTPTPGFTPTGSMAQDRAKHAAVLLDNGKVLVAGGLSTGSPPLTSAELYEPATGRFSPTSSLANRRQDFTATKLQNGKVLVVGGDDRGCCDLAGAELYDPVGGTFSSTGSLSTGRSGHAATLLPTGKVLIVGGYGDGYPGRYLSSSEIYDPASATFSPTGSMATARSDHTATLLGNGKVLVSGGWAGGPIASAELYDPSTGGFSPTGSLSSARFGHTGTLLPNGRVLIAGGGTPSGSSWDSSATAELYDPNAGTFSNAGSMTVARKNHTATLLPTGKTLIVGGCCPSSIGALTSAELFDPSTMTFAVTANMTEPLGRTFHTATLLGNGSVLIAGGAGNGTTATAELYITSPTPLPTFTPTPTVTPISQPTFTPTRVPAPGAPPPGRIAYSHPDRAGQPNIYVMNSDGSGQTRLTNDATGGYNPAWSPDGRRIAFCASRNAPGIYVMNSDGSGQTQLTNNPNSTSRLDRQPAWSPDGRRIAFSSYREGDWQIYVMNADGSVLTQLTNGRYDKQPAWSPDGQRIAFTLSSHIYLMNSDGSGQTRLTYDWSSDPAWSPDGRRIAFTSYPEGNGAIYVMNSDGSGQTRLTKNTADDYDPTWSPDGRRIAFTSERDGNTEIYVMNSDGSGQTRLTYDGGCLPAWSPLAATVVPPTPTPPAAPPTPTPLAPAPTPTPTRTSGPVDTSKLVLARGWNLVSIPKALANSNVSTVFSGVTAVDKVYAFSDGAWNLAVFAGGTWSGTLTELVPGAGYWVTTLADTTVPLSYRPVDPLAPPPTYSLPAGWSLIGYATLSLTSSQPTGMYLNSLSGNWMALYGYDSSTGYVLAKPSYGFPNVELFHGYWLYLSAAGTLVP